MVWMRGCFFYIYGASDDAPIITLRKILSPPLSQKTERCIVMHAIKMQTAIGREIFETGIVPELPHFGPFWNDNDQPLFEEIDINLDELPEGTVLKVDRGHFYANAVYFRKESKGWMRLPIEGEYPYPHMPISGEDVIFQNANEIMIVHTPES